MVPALGRASNALTKVGFQHHAKSGAHAFRAVFIADDDPGDGAIFNHQFNHLGGGSHVYAKLLCRQHLRCGKPGARTAFVMGQMAFKAGAYVLAAILHRHPFV